MELPLRRFAGSPGPAIARVRAAHAGEPRRVGRWRALDTAQRLARSARADPSTPALQPRGGKRGSPIEAVVLTGGEIDQTAGLLSLRERRRSHCMRPPRRSPPSPAIRCSARWRPTWSRRARRARRAVCARPRRLEGRAVHRAGQGSALSRRRRSGDRARKARPMSASRLSDGRARLAYMPGAAAMTPALRDAACARATRSCSTARCSPTTR